jgi:hypothetical protein
VDASVADVSPAQGPSVFAIVFMASVYAHLHGFARGRATIRHIVKGKGTRSYPEILSFQPEGSTAKLLISRMVHLMESIDYERCKIYFIAIRDLALCS